MSFSVPVWAKSPRQRIIEIYMEERTVPGTAKRLGYKSPSFVRKVIHEYRVFLTTQEG